MGINNSSGEDVGVVKVDFINKIINVTEEDNSQLSEKLTKSAINMTPQYNIKTRNAWACALLTEPLSSLYL